MSTSLDSSTTCDHHKKRYKKRCDIYDEPYLVTIDHPDDARNSSIKKREGSEKGS